MPLSFIKSSGNIITEDFCLSLASETKADYVKDKSFGPNIKKVDEIIAVSFDLLRERWEEIRSQLLTNRFDNATLRKRWILPLLEMLDYNPVYVASNIKSESGVEYHIPYKGWESEYAPVIQLVHSSQDFDNKDKNSRTHPNKSPQDSLQQYLNTSHNQWAILINGKKVRVLRDFFHSITKGFLEFDLEGIFETGDSEQFRVLYRILHRSRIENQYQGEQEIEFDEEGNPIEIEDNCLLEKFHKKSRETGVKVGNKLRDQVIDAIEQLGNGFAEDLDPDTFQNGKVKDFYNEILNIIYRLLFLMFAEQKGWLPVRNSIYARTYSINALREKAELGNYSHDEEKDLWEGLRITFRLVAEGYVFRNGDTINAFGGQLFSDRKIKKLLQLSLKNKYLLDAIYGLSYFKLDKLVNRINYANLAIDELGSVYESLLDYEPKLARESLKLGNREIRRGEFYLDNRGTDRKTTGSYYTDTRLVTQLIESALVPVINTALALKNTPKEREDSLLDLKVADIACGSGAFLCAALEKMGEQLALIRMGDEERPTEEQLREAKRDVLLNCIHGVDLNPMAIELAKFSLWITASLPDMPLTFLDHKLKCGNSLIGATQAMIEKGIPEEAFKPVGNDNPEICSKLKKKVKKQLESLSMVHEPSVQYTIHLGKADGNELLRLREKLNSRKQEFSADVEEAEEEYRRLEKMERMFKEWLMADVWAASFFIEKTDHDLELYPTNATLENLRENQPVNSQLIEQVMQVASKYHFFHFHLEFPEVFKKGGFDCLIGNPPWEKITLLEREFFSSFENIREEKRSNLRKQRIETLKDTHPETYSSWINANIEVEKQKHFLISSQRFILSAVGELNLYPLFVENNLNLINEKGFSGIIIKSGMLQSPTWANFTQYLIGEKKISSAYDFRNWKGWFPAIGYHERFTLLSLTKYSEDISIAFYLDDPLEIKFSDKSLNITTEECFLFNPISKNIPSFKNNKQKQFLRDIYSKHRCLFESSSSWPIRYSSGLHMTSDAKELRTFEELMEDGFELTKGNDFRKGDVVYLKLYEGKLIHQYDHRFATFHGIPKEIRFGIKAPTHSPNTKEKSNIDYEILPRYWVSKQYFLDDIEKRDLKCNWFISFRDVTNVVSNFRTAVGCLIINSISNYTAPNIIIDIADKTERLTNTLLFLALFNSIPFDYIIRIKFYGAHLLKNILLQMPVPTSHLGDKLKNEILYRVLKLVSTTNQYTNLCSMLGYKLLHEDWNESERHKLRCELDAIYFHLYLISKEQIDLILDDFVILKTKEIGTFGVFRTKEAILLLYDEFAWVRDELNS